MTTPNDLIEAVNLYLDGIHECDIDKLGIVFHPASSLFDSDEGKVFVEPIESFLQDVSTRTSPASVGQEKEADILLIDYLSPINATVKIRIRAHRNVFVDHLGFVKGEAGWQIVSKIWHLESVVEGVDDPNAS
ncbi:MAG: nuclear transport factor 2 family protein [Pelagimonas sp.]|uniref:nuclear transport factor 2 family protein n=1 Tax=Pelagimonas sp. TaxID=2073170 RepID=UPI003D6A536D